MELTENIRKLMDLSDRKQFGKQGKTYDEAEAGAVVKAEKTLHNQYWAFLKRNGFNMDQVIHAPMNKKSILPEGFPDFTVMRGGKTMLVEFKVGTNTCSEAQDKVIDGLLADKWFVLVLNDLKTAAWVTKRFFGLS